MCECLEYSDGDAYVCEACWPIYQMAWEEHIKLHKDDVETIELIDYPIRREKMENKLSFGDPWTQSKVDDLLMFFDCLLTGEEFSNYTLEDRQSAFESAREIIRGWAIVAEEYHQKNKNGVYFDRNKQNTDIAK
jgi:hypothetical protein